MAFNSDHSRLLVGNACGHILEYDMKDGKLVRTLNDVHPPEAAILHLKVYYLILELNFYFPANSQSLYSDLHILLTVYRFANSCSLVR